MEPARGTIHSRSTAGTWAYPGRVCSVFLLQPPMQRPPMQQPMQQPMRQQMQQQMQQQPMQQQRMSADGGGPPARVATPTYALPGPGRTSGVAATLAGMRNPCHRESGTRPTGGTSGEAVPGGMRERMRPDPGETSDVAAGMRPDLTGETSGEAALMGVRERVVAAGMRPDPGRSSGEAAPMAGMREGSGPCAVEIYGAAPARAPLRVIPAALPDPGGSSGVAGLMREAALPDPGGTSGVAGPLKEAALPDPGGASGVAGPMRGMRQYHLERERAHRVSVAPSERAHSALCERARRVSVCAE